MTKALARPYHHMDEVRRSLIVQSLHKGYSRRASARLAGVSWSNFHRWMGSSELLDGPFVDGDRMTFRELVEEAEAAALVALETVVLRRASIDPAVAMRLLNRRDVELWRDPETQQRLREGALREELLRAELEAARMELELLREERDAPRGGESSRSGGGSPPICDIEIEYVETTPKEDHD